MAQPALIAALRDRAECCFAFRVAGNAARPLPGGSESARIVWQRSSALRDRHGRLFEADLALCAAGDAFAEGAR